MDAQPRVDGPSQAKGTGSYVPVACGSCKKTKRKCDGNQPCRNCVDKGRECVYDQSQDRRRGRRRTMEELYTKVEALDAILESLRTSDDASVQELLALIRNDTPIETIVQHARGILAKRDHAGNQTTPNPRTRQHVMSIASLIDNPPVRVPAQPWTSLADDDAVSHLISVYFVWHHDSFPSLDKETFIKAMNSKDLSSPFCSPFLVNSMLMMASAYTDHPAAFADPDDSSTRLVHFFDEAMALWDKEDGNTTLTNLQALIPLLLGCPIAGRDTMSSMFANQISTLSEDLVKKVSTGLERGDKGYASVEYQKSYSLAIWSAFVCLVDTALAGVKQLDIKVPIVRRPHSGQELETTISHRPYPQIGPEATFAPHGVADQKFTMHVIGAQLVPVMLSEHLRDGALPGYIILEKAERLFRLAEVEQALHRWYEQLPPYARIELFVSTPSIALVDSHLVYHIFQIVLNNSVLGILGSDLDSAGDAVSSSTNRKSRAEQNLIAACHGIASLFQWLQQTITLVYFPCFTVQASTLGLYNLLDYLSSTEYPQVPMIFHSLVVALSAGSRRSTSARAVMKMLWVTIQNRKLESYLLEVTVKYANPQGRE